jgi:glycosyltransferase involved in cell wall biosynthesis
MRRKEIMLSFQYDENWIGGTYYILNIIKALNKIDDRDKPKLTILHSPESSLAEIEKIGYPYLEYMPFSSKLPSYKRMLNRLFYFFTSATVFTVKLPRRVENFYPAINHSINRSNIGQYYTWIGDFQEQYLPQFFSKVEVLSRKFWHRLIVNSKTPVVFSSHNALEDFDKFYPNNQNKKAVLRFASILGTKYKDLRIEELRKKYGITKPYFIVTNQFWKHKNHETAIKAFELLSQTERDVQLVLTGKEHDYRNPEYPAELKRKTLEKNPGNRILFLGFIDRDDQLKLMKESLAVVQPSLFEGWSTVVEDSKALGKFIIASDLPIHREQLDANCFFFQPMNEKELCEKMKRVLTSPPAVNPLDYEKLVKDFAYTFLALFPDDRNNTAK